MTRARRRLPGLPTPTSSRRPMSCRRSPCCHHPLISLPCSARLRNPSRRSRPRSLFPRFLQRRVSSPSSSRLPLWTPKRPPRRTLYDLPSCSPFRSIGEWAVLRTVAGDALPLQTDNAHRFRHLRACHGSHSRTASPLGSSVGTAAHSVEKTDSGVVPEQLERVVCVLPCYRGACRGAAADGLGRAFVWCVKQSRARSRGTPRRQVPVLLARLGQVDTAEHVRTRAA